MAPREKSWGSHTAPIYIKKAPTRKTAERFLNKDIKI